MFIIDMFLIKAHVYEERLTTKTLQESNFSYQKLQASLDAIIVVH